jgi:hypothetical protein
LLYRSIWVWDVGVGHLVHGAFCAPGHVVWFTLRHAVGADRVVVLPRRFRWPENLFSKSVAPAVVSRDVIITVRVGVIFVIITVPIVTVPIRRV